MNQNRPQTPTARQRPSARLTPDPQPWLGREAIIKNIRRLIWLYFVLLICEGALRKWVVPQLSDPLLIIRDPIVILIFLLAIRARIFPRSNFIYSLAMITALSWFAGILVLLPYLSIKTAVLVTGFGFRSNFLHLPLIFVIPTVFNIKDVKRMGWWMILGMIPMAVLMAYQFHASPDSFINRTVGLGEEQQIHTGGGKIRPPGTFSFISGAIFYLTITTAFLLHAVLTRLKYKSWILLASGAGLIVGVAVSGSRGAVISVGLVVATLAFILVIRPDSVPKFGRILLLVSVLGWGLSHLPILRQGVGIISDRFTQSAQEAETSIAGGLLARVYEGYFEGFEVIDRVPLFGYGLGLGTNGGAHFLSGRAGFLLAENENSRILLESGSFLGLAFIVWRLVLTVRIFYLAFLQLRLGRILPILLFSSGFFALLNGPFGQPTNVGFAVLLMGLCLAAANPETDADVLASAESTARLKPTMPAKLPGRSVHAARLHETSAAPDYTNDSADR